MARARGRDSSNGVAARSKNTAPLPVSTPPRRQSQRISSSATKGSTPRKSVYFEHSSGEEDAADDASSTAYEDDNERQSSVSTGGEDEDEDNDSSEDTGSRKRKRGPPTSSNGTSRKAIKGGELWREGVKSDLQPGEEVFIALPKARDAGKTPYRDEAIHPNTMLFLGDLKRNNERAWLKLHDADFRQSERDFKSFVEQMSEQLIEVDETIPELPVKDVVFRIYRDVRFSNDPTPYKSHFSVAWSRTGRKGPYAAYYLQIAPGKSFVGGGLWCPEASYLAMLRDDFDHRPQRIKSVLMNSSLRKEFLKGAENEKKALKMFESHNSENALKRHPKGYSEDHPNIGLLRLKSFTMGRKLDDSEVTSPKFLHNLKQIMKVLTPFITYLNDVVMPDPNSVANDDADDS